MIYDYKFRGVWHKNCFYLNANYFGRWEFSKIFKIEIIPPVTCTLYLSSHGKHQYICVCMPGFCPCCIFMTSSFISNLTDSLCRWGWVGIYF